MSDAQQEKARFRRVARRYQRFQAQLEKEKVARAHEKDLKKNPRFVPKLTKTMLEFPEDIGTNPEYGHVVIFHFLINQSAEGSWLGKSGVRELKASPMAVLKKNGRTVQAAKEIGGTSSSMRKDAIGHGGSAGMKGFSIPDIVRSTLSIGMYLPSSALSTTYSHNYSDVPLGGIATGLIMGGLAAASEGAQGNLMNMWTGAIKAVSGGLESAGKAALLKSVSKLGDKSATAGGIGKSLLRQAYNPRIEFLYDSTSPREFTYTFTMIPSSESEANKIQSIVQAFKEHSHPTLQDDNKFIHFPNQFDIEYLILSGGEDREGAFNSAKRNQYLHKVSTCVLSGMTVNTAGSGQAQFFRPNEYGAPPIQTDMSLTFKETEILTSNRVAEGY